MVLQVLLCRFRRRWGENTPETALSIGLWIVLCPAPSEKVGLVLFFKGVFNGCLIPEPPLCAWPAKPHKYSQAN